MVEKKKKSLPSKAPQTKHRAPQGFLDMVERQKAVQENDGLPEWICIPRSRRAEMIGKLALSARIPHLLLMNWRVSTAKRIC